MNPTDPNNPLARAARALEMLDFIFQGYTTQVAVTEALQDLMHLEDAYPEKLHLIGALDDARNQYELTTLPAEPAGTAQFSGLLNGAGLAATSPQPSAQIIDLEAVRFAKGHGPDVA